MTDTDEKAEPTRLKLPRQRASWLVRGYTLFGAAVLVLYVLADVWGLGLDESEKEVLPRSVRQAPGGYRGYALWHSGYQGGK